MDHSGIPGSHFFRPVTVLRDNRNGKNWSQFDIYTLKKHRKFCRIADGVECAIGNNSDPESISLGQQNR